MHCRVFRHNGSVRMPVRYRDGQMLSSPFLQGGMLELADTPRQRLRVGEQSSGMGCHVAFVLSLQTL